MSESIEPQLLAALRDAPADEATRGVYADWLEQHGYEPLARFVRGEAVAEIGQHCEWQWREITSRAKVMCTGPSCAGRWDLMAPTEQDRVRACSECAMCPVYCLTENEARNAGLKGHPAAFDAVRERELAKQWQRYREPWKHGIRWNPPRPSARMSEPVVAKTAVETACELITSPETRGR